MLYKNELTGAIDLAADPHNPKIIYRRALAGAPPALEFLERWTRKRLVSIDGWRPDLVAAHGAWTA